MMYYTHAEVNTPVGNCSTGDVRLNPYNLTSIGQEGRLELCINNAWGTICDSLFGVDDAAVACSRLTGYSRQGEGQSEC